MKNRIEQICELLNSERPDLQCAAALVLGELGSADPQIVKHLGETLANGGDQNLKGYVLEALEKIGSQRSLDFVLPLLETEGVHREQAIRVVGRLGAGVARKLGARLKDASPDEAMAIRLALARVRGVQGIRLLLESLITGDLAGVDQTLAAIRQEMSGATQKDRRLFVEEIRQFLAGTDARRSMRAQVVALRILGYLDDSTAQPILLRYSRPSKPTPVRTAALTALRSVPRPRRGEERLVRELSGYLGEKDFAGIVRPTLELLHPIPFNLRTMAVLEGLTRSARSEVKRFALRKLGEIDAERSAEILMRYVCNGDAHVRDVAGEALMALASARKLVLTRLMRESDVERAWLLARIVKPAASELSSEQVGRLGERAIRLLDQENRVFEPLLYLLTHASRQETQAVLMKRGLRKKRSRRFDEAARSFRLLEKCGLFDSEARYQLALSLLKQSSRSPERDRRANDPSLELIVELISEDFPLFDRLRKETVLTPDELYYLGWHFAEQENSERALGAQILHLVMRKAPRSHLSKDARGVLQLRGLK